MWAAIVLHSLQKQSNTADSRAREQYLRRIPGHVENAYGYAMLCSVGLEVVRILQAEAADILSLPLCAHTYALPRVHFHR